MDLHSPAPASPAVAVPPSGEFLYTSGRSANDVSAYRINRTTGALAPISGSPFAAGTEPFFIAISSSGQFVYAPDAFSDQISGYSIDASTGALMPLEGSPFNARAYLECIALVNPATKACGALNVSAEATLTPGPTHQPRTDLWNESLTITNGVTPVSGPLSVVLLGLLSSTTTLSGTYPGLTTTYCFSTAGTTSSHRRAPAPRERRHAPAGRGAFRAVRFRGNSERCRGKADRLQTATDQRNAEQVVKCREHGRRLAPSTPASDIRLSFSPATMGKCRLTVRS